MSIADDIFKSWDEATKKHLKGAPEMTLEAALGVLKDPSKDVNARALMVMYMGVLKTTEDEGDLGRLQAAMFDQFGKSLNLKKTWFTGMGQAVMRLRKQAKKGLGDVGHITDVDVSQPYADMVKRAASGLKFRHKKDPEMFRTVAGISRIKRVREANVVSIERLNRDGFTSDMESDLYFYKEDKEGNRKSEPAPKELARHLFSRSDMLELPFLRRLVSSPVYGPSGLIVERGYHEGEQLYYEPPQGLNVPPVPERVSADDVKEAIRLIAEEWLGDYPFDGWTRDELVTAALSGDPENPPPASFLNLVGAALEQMVRTFIKGSIPMTLIDKPSPRTGASMLAGQLQMLTDGEPSMQVLSKKEEEVEKRITGSLLGGKNRITYDNVKGLVNSASLAMLLTTKTFTGRILSVTGEVEIPVTLSVTMTGINPSFTKEMSERINRVRLDAQMERPGTRTGFRHADLDQWVEKNRGQLVWALIVLARNWQQKGSPGPVKAVAWGAYRSYVEVIGGILEAAAPNWTTWQDNRAALVAESEEDDPIKQMLAVWWSDSAYPLSMPVSAKKAKCLTAMLSAEEIELPVTANTGQPYDYRAGSLGKFLGGFDNTVHNIAEQLGKEGRFEVKLMKGARSSNGWVWKVEAVDNVVAGDFGGKDNAAASSVAADAANTAPEAPAPVKAAPVEARQEAAPAPVQKVTDRETGRNVRGHRAAKLAAKWAEMKASEMKASH